ncbi:MAG: TIGR04283 family arsenosugar biosynthesis glycosyltransferase [Caldimicrobium sp.]|jgi:rSAM/selenodomain-associated transferase 2
MRVTLSVIIPTFNEELHIDQALKSLELIDPDEVIVVDAGSTDRTREKAEAYGAKVIQSEKNRGIQLKKGAKLAKGNLLFFMHADCKILDKIDLRKLYKKGIKAGFLNLCFDKSSLSLKLLERLINLRARLFNLPYGDQGLFIERALYEKIGGFKEYPFLEDLDLVLRLKRFYPPFRLPGKILVSSRKFNSKIPFYPFLISLRNNLIILLFLLGFSPNYLKNFYK